MPRPTEELLVLPRWCERKGCVCCCDRNSVSGYGLLRTTLETLMSKDKELKDLFLDTLKDIYFAEKKILSALPKMAKAAQSPRLKAAFEQHHTETDGQVERLEQVFASIDEAPKGKTCDAIMGI